MTKSIRFETAKRTVKALLVGTVLAGAMVSIPAVAKDDVDKASEALRENEADKAVRYAEKAVEAAPRDADRRALLGQAYLRAGRLVSARDALNDAVALGDSSPRVGLMLALAQIGSGNPRAGIATLSMHGNAIPAADRGLAFALAGDAGRGVEIISDDIRMGNNTSKSRQNLAYAFALAGRWKEARLMAAQDVPANMIDQRITEWATTARPDQVATRVAALLGAEAVADSGMPRALALANFPAAQPKAAPVMAAAKPASVAPTPAVKAEPVVVAEAKPAPVVVAEAKPAPAPVAAKVAPVSKPVIVASLPPSSAAEKPAPVAAPAKPAPAPAKVASVSPVKKAPVRQAAAKPALPTPGASGSHIAQLGSYTSEANALAGWKVFQSRYANLNGQKPVITRAVVDGKDYYRVAAGGFDAKGAAAMCSAVKASGHGCLAIAQVNNAGSSPVKAKVRVAKVD